MKATENYLLKLLSNNDVTFFIPPYQRNYEWDEEQCEVFFEDILKTAKSNNEGNYSEHFFGTIVFVENESVFGRPSKLVLTDGQQRITTAMLFLVAVREVIDDEETREHINSKYLRNDNASSEDAEYKIKLKQVETDWEAYRSIILGLELSEDDKDSAVYRNYSYFLANLRKLQEKNEIVVVDLISKGLDKFSIVTIQLEPLSKPWENPQEVFESMNSLGKPLALADLARNYLLLGKEPEEQDKLYKDYWLQIEKTLPDQVSNFIRDFMQLKGETDYKKATSANYKELYANFKDLFKEEETEVLLAQLKRYSSFYASIVLGKTTGSVVVDNYLADLRSIGVTTTYSYLLSLLQEWKSNRFSDSDVCEILEALVVYFVRRRILKLTSAENKALPQLVKRNEEIISSERSKKMTMFDILAGQEHAMRLPNDIEVENELRTMNFYNFNYAKFILSMVEEKITKSRPDKSDKNLQIEHIMPQTLNSHWIKELGVDFESVHQEFVNNIGNLTLIRHNQELGNKSFESKKEMYRNKAGLQIAKDEIINRSKWNKNSIQNRLKWITQMIVDKALPIPDKMKRRNNFAQKDSKRLSFIELQLLGEEINYISDKSIKVKVINDRKVLFEGEEWFLSPLTNEIETRKGTVTNSGSYQGAQYWEYEGIRLADIM